MSENTFDSYDQHVPPSPRRDAETLKVLKFFFQEMCLAERTPPAQAVQYLPEYLLRWIETNYLGYARDEVLEKAGAEEIGWQFLHEILNNAVGALMLVPLWPAITLAHRGNPKHSVKGLHFTMQVSWEDGRLEFISLQAPAALMTGGVINDALLGCQLNKVFKFFMGQVVELGLDRLHDRADDFGGEYPYEVLIGLMRQVIFQVKPEIQQYVHRYMRLCEALFESPQAAADKQKSAALEATRLKQQSRQVLSSSSGGFAQEDDVTP